jgi:hypothetical protein
MTNVSARRFSDEILLLMVEAFIDGLLHLNSGSIEVDEIDEYVFDYLVEKSSDLIQANRVYELYKDE